MVSKPSVKAPIGTIYCLKHNSMTSWRKTSHLHAIQGGDADLQHERITIEKLGNDVTGGNKSRTFVPIAMQSKP